MHSTIEETARLPRFSLGGNAWTIGILASVAALTGFGASRAPTATLLAVFGGLALAIGWTGRVRSVGIVLLIGSLGIQNLKPYSEILGFGTANLAALLILGSAIFHSLLGARSESFSWRSTRPYLALLGWVAISLAWSPDRPAGLALLMLLSLPLMVIRLAPGGNVRRWWAAAVVGSAAVTLLITIVGPIGASGSRLAGLLGSQRLAMWFGVSALYFLNSRGRKNIALGSLALVMVLLSQSITGLIALTLAGLVTWIILSPGRLRALTGLTLAAIVVAGGAPTALDRLSDESGRTTLLDNGSLEGRRIVWDFITAEYIDGHVLVGRGAGATRAAFEGTQLNTGAGDVHNDYLKLRAETGLVGLTLYLLTLAMILFRAVRRSNPRLLAVCLFVAVFSYTDNVISSSLLTLVPLALVVVEDAYGLGQARRMHRRSPSHLIQAADVDD